MSIFGYIFAIALLVFVLVGIWYEEKFIKFEDKICDRLGYIIARVIIAHRRRKADKAIMQIEKAHETISKNERKLRKMVRDTRTV